MASDLPDVELYHQERLKNLEMRSKVIKRKMNREQALKDTTPPKDEDSEFVSSYARERGYCPEK